MRLSALPNEQLQTMASAAFEIDECQRVLERASGNVVAELLNEVETFYEFDHCPPGDIYDLDSHSQYYYHAHREGEHGHFHTFLREAGMPAGLEPVAQSEADFMRERDDRLSHLIGISMDANGVPLALFTTNRWITADHWYAAEDVIRMLDCFEIDHAWPSWPTNRWVTAMLKLFRPQIETLIRARDDAIADWRQRHPDADPFEDRNLDILSWAEISVEKQTRAVLSELEARSAVAPRMAGGQDHPAHR